PGGHRRGDRGLPRHQPDRVAARERLAKGPPVTAGWEVVRERFRFILLGAYPFDEQWRPALACLLFVALYAATAFWAGGKRRLLLAWIAMPTAALLLLRGGVLGLRPVPSESWGGLPV